MTRRLSLLIGAWLFTVAVSVYAADGPEKVVCKSGRWEVCQRWDGEAQWKEALHFREPGQIAVMLEGLMWPGVYEASPDGKWLLRIQKTGSGESEGRLYRVEENGRVSEVAGFDDLLWSASPVGKSQLYHTGIGSVEWAGDSAAVKVKLQGKGEGKPGLEATIRYDVGIHQARCVSSF